MRKISFIVLSFAILLSACNRFTEEDKAKLKESLVQAFTAPQNSSEPILGLWQLSEDSLAKLKKNQPKENLEYTFLKVLRLGARKQVAIFTITDEIEFGGDIREYDRYKETPENNYYKVFKIANLNVKR